MTEVQGEDRPLSLEPVSMVAIDLDGTLLRQDGSICFHGAEAIFEAVERGVKVVIATGRAPRSVRSIYKSLGLDTPLVCHNGALLLSPDNRIVEHLTLRPAIARKVIELARAAEPQVMIGIENFDQCYTEKSARSHMARRPDIAASSAGSGHEAADAAATGIAELGANDHALGPFAAVLNDPVTKIMFVGEPHVLGGVQSALKERLADEVSFAFSHMRLLQVVHRKADKATALAQVAEQFGMGSEQVMAIGDAPNDIGMIRWAGLGIALANAWPEVQHAAHFIVRGNDDGGVAEAIGRFVLNAHENG
jgi:Cof subfamily protein (haloacid dehalogenase superfamily)